MRRRVEAVEKRQRHRKPLPTIITGIYPEEQPGTITGIEGDGGTRVRLKVGETMDQLQRRAVATLPGRFLQVLYAATAAPERPSELLRYRTPSDSPIVRPWPAVAGIGRVASRDELIRMGAVGFPVERLI